MKEEIYFARRVLTHKESEVNYLCDELPNVPPHRNNIHILLHRDHSPFRRFLLLDHNVAH